MSYRPVDEAFWTDPTDDQGEVFIDPIDILASKVIEIANQRLRGEISEDEWKKRIKEVIGKK